MAFRAMHKYWRSTMANNSFVAAAAGERTFASSTTPKMKILNPTAEALDAPHPKSRGEIKGDYAPIMMVLGMVLVASAIGIHTAKQHLFHSPAVQVNKKRRESIAEVDNPEMVVGNADKFLNKSFLRKVAHIQDPKPTLSDPVRANPYTKSREIETVKNIRGN